MSYRVDPDETAHMSRLIWIYAVCKSLLLSPVAVKELKERYCYTMTERETDFNYFVVFDTGRVVTNVMRTCGPTHLLFLL